MPDKWGYAYDVVQLPDNWWIVAEYKHDKLMAHIGLPFTSKEEGEFFLEQNHWPRRSKEGEK